MFSSEWCREIAKVFFTPILWIENQSFKEAYILKWQRGNWTPGPVLVYFHWVWNSSCRKVTGDIAAPLYMLLVLGTKYLLPSVQVSHFKRNKNKLKHSLDWNKLHENRSGLSFSTLYPITQQDLAQSRCTIIIYWINEWIWEMMKDLETKSFRK